MRVTHEEDAVDAERRRLTKALLYGNSENDQHPIIKMVAPMVRYSKLPFRMLCRKWGSRITFTPMIIAESFNRSAESRDSDFSTCELDRPLVVQFATNSPDELAAAVTKVTPYVDAIDVNCGCPQRWAIQQGIGAALSAQPQLVRDLITAAKSRTHLPVSIKIRLHKNFERTLELVRLAEEAGVSWITVHGRTASQGKGSDVNRDLINRVKDASKVPIIANGDVFEPRHIEHACRESGGDGVMCARGMLANPALFAGEPHVPIECVVDYVHMAVNYPSAPFAIHQRHVAFMLHDHVTRSDRLELHSLQSMSGLIDFLDRRGWWRSLE